MAIPIESIWRSRAMIIFIALISVGPMVLAWYYAKHPELITKRSNYGNLITPPSSLDLDELFRHPLNPLMDLNDAKGRWLLMHVILTPCEEQCTESSYKTRQVRLMLNKEIPRLRRLLLVPESVSSESVESLLKSDETLLAVTVTQDELQKLASAIGGPLAGDLLILVDPMGNLVLWYEPSFDPYRLLKDLQHLLRASRIG